MNENSSKKREWVKTAAIIFLSVLLVLTFFSNTIMNYSLPEVAAKYAESGTITAKIRGGGIVESNDPYEVTIKETRKVSSVAVTKGTQVQKGDVLVYLEDEDSTELKAAQEKLKAAQDAYDKALLSANVTDTVIKDSQSNKPTSNYRQQLTNAQREVENAQNELKAWQEDYDALTAENPTNPVNRIGAEDQVDNYKEAKKQKENADLILLGAQNELAAITAKLTTSANDAGLEAQKAKAQQAVNDAKAAVSNADLSLGWAKKALDDKIDLADINKKAAEKNLQEKQDALNKLVGNINETLSLESLKEAVDDAQKEVDKQMEKSTDAVITAGVTGTVTSINAVSGKEVSAAQPVAVIQPEGKGYTMSFSVTKDQAQRLSVGDRADLVNSWRYDDVEIVLTSIKPDTTDPSQKKLLTFDITGDVTAGQSLNISVGQKSSNYDTIVPNSAIREDNNGKFVLQVVQKSSPLGNRYVAQRVDVEVLASDDTRSAVTGGLESYAFVITTSTKPVEAGQLVRLANDSN